MRRLGVLFLALGAASPLSAGSIEARRDARGQIIVGNLPAGTYVAPATPPRPAAASAAPEAPVVSRSLMPLIREAAARHRLAPQLVRAVVEVESAFDPRAVSSKGARGLMQLMPATARELGVEDVYDPRRNLDGGSRYLRKMLDTFDGDLELALAAYNAGPDTVHRYGGVPPYPETRRYIEKVLDRLRDARRAVDAPPRIYRYRDSSGRLVISNLAPDSIGRQVGPAEQLPEGSEATR